MYAHMREYSAERIYHLSPLSRFFGEMKDKQPYRDERGGSRLSTPSGRSRTVGFYRQAGPEIFDILGKSVRGDSLRQPRDGRYSNGYRQQRPE
jgi:hypothetical protein